MSYRAKSAYRVSDVADRYDTIRFRSLQGQLTDALEKRLILRGLAGLPRGARILDLPVGTGRLTPLLRDLGYRVTGADISLAMLRHAHERDLALPLLAGDAEQLPFPDQSFDAVISLRLFHHIPAAVRPRILAEMGRVARSLVVATFAETLSLQGYLRKRASERDPHRMPIYPARRDEAYQDAAQAGLRVIGDWQMVPLYASTHLYAFEPRHTQDGSGAAPSTASEAS